MAMTGISVELSQAFCTATVLIYNKSNRKAMNRHWLNQKANPALKTKTGNK